MGAVRFSLYTDYGFEPDLAELVENYTDYYRDKVNENKNSIVKSFLMRDFDKIHPIMQQNDKVMTAPFQRTIGVGQTMCQINNNIEDVPSIHTVFNTNFSHIEQVCSNEFDEGFITEKNPLEESKRIIARKNFQIKNLSPLEGLGKTRETLKKEEVIDAPYNEKAAK